MLRKHAKFMVSWFEKFNLQPDFSKNVFDSLKTAKIFPGSRSSVDSRDHFKNEIFSPFRLLSKTIWRVSGLKFFSPD